MMAQPPPPLLVVLAMTQTTWQPWAKQWTQLATWWRACLT
jgi:hypothetical protein